jgi:ATP-dependent helicase HrpB
VKLQEMFGMAEAPAVSGIRVLCELTAPNGRVAATTSDLASFWASGYALVR